MRPASATAALLGRCRGCLWDALPALPRAAAAALAPPRRPASSYVPSTTRRQARQQSWHLETPASLEARLCALEEDCADHRWVSAREVYSMVRSLRRMPGCGALCRRALQLASDAGVSLNGSSLADIMQGFAHSGDHAGALAVEREVLASSEAWGDPLVLARLVHSHLLLGRSERALEVVDAARSSALRGGALGSDGSASASGSSSSSSSARARARAGAGSAASSSAAATAGGGDPALLVEVLRAVEEYPILPKRVASLYRSEREAAVLAAKLRAIGAAHMLLRYLSARHVSSAEADALARHMCREQGLEEAGSAADADAAAAATDAAAGADAPGAGAAEGEAAAGEPAPSPAPAPPAALLPPPAAPERALGRALWLPPLARLLTSAALAPALSPPALALACAALLAGAGLGAPAFDRHAVLTLYCDATGLSTEEMLHYFSEGAAAAGGGLRSPGLRLLARALEEHPPSRRSARLGNDRVHEAQLERGAPEAAAAACASVLEVASGAWGSGGSARRGGVEALLTAEALEVLLGLREEGGGSAGAGAGAGAGAAPGAAPGALALAQAAPLAAAFRAAPAGSAPSPGTLLDGGAPAAPWQALLAARHSPTLVFGATPGSDFGAAWVGAEALGPSPWLDLQVRLAVGGYVHLLRGGGGGGGGGQGVPRALHEHVLCALVHRGFYSAALQVAGVMAREEQGRRALGGGGGVAGLVEEALQRVAEAGLVQGDAGGLRRAVLGQ